MLYFMLDNSFMVFNGFNFIVSGSEKGSSVASPASLAAKTSASGVSLARFQSYSYSAR